MQPTTKQFGIETHLDHTGRGVSAALWVLQALLAALYLFSGVMKFVMPMEQMTKGSNLPGWFFLFIGVAEILGAIGLVIPALLRIAPWLTPLAACGLVVIMIGATVLTLPMGMFALFPGVVCALTAIVAYGRFRWRPILAKR